MVVPRGGAPESPAGSGSRARIIEAGHFYAAKGPTRLSVISWQIACQLAQPQDARMLFVDDVHALDAMHPLERVAEPASFMPEPKPTYEISESAMCATALESLESLRALPRRWRARKSAKSGRWYCAGFPLTQPNGYPMCLLFDLGLTLHKHRLGFAEAINVLPSFYELEQRRLIKLAGRIIPSFSLEVVLFRETGETFRLNGRKDPTVMLELV